MRRRTTPKEHPPQAPQGQPPGVRELLRMLIEDARMKVRQATMPKQATPPVPRLVELLYTKHQEVRKRLGEIERTLQARGYRVDNYKPYGLSPIESTESKRRAEWEAAQTKRHQTIRQIHQQALLDLLTLQGKDARTYLEGLRASLAQVTQ